MPENIVIEQEIKSEIRKIKSRLGFDVHISDELGNTLQKITVPDTVGRTFHIYMDRLDFKNEELNDMLVQFIEFRIQHYMPSTILSNIKAFYPFVKVYHETNKDDFDNTELFISHVLERTISLEVEKGNQRVKEPLIIFYKHCIIHEIIGFNLDYYYDSLFERRASGRNAYQRVLQYDPELGPYVDSEIALINEKLIKNEKIPIETRTLLSIYKTFGLRPIQVALLRETDFFYDEILDEYYLNIPRVKQNHFRRRDEFTKREVPDEIVVLIKDLIKINKQQYPDAPVEIRPIFFRTLYTNIHINNKSNTPYFYHRLAKHFEHVMKDACKEYLPISPRTGEFLNLTAYRFRYTVGTQAVLDGKSETEVMALLDHSNPGSVKHYFKLTHEFGDVLNELTNSRVEQKSFVAAWSKKDDVKGNIYTTDIIDSETETLLGGCHLTTECNYEPGVGCYGCGDFVPSRNKTAHTRAKNVIENRINEIKDNSTGHTPNQLTTALYGAEAAIDYSSNPRKKEK